MSIGAIFFVLAEFFLLRKSSAMTMNCIGIFKIMIKTVGSFIVFKVLDEFKHIDAKHVVELNNAKIIIVFGA